MATTSDKLSCQQALACFVAQGCDNPCGAPKKPPPPRGGPQRGPSCQLTDTCPPCQGVSCLGPAPLGGEIITVGCAPCEDGSVPSMPNCDCAAGQCGCGPIYCDCVMQKCIDACPFGAVECGQSCQAAGVECVKAGAYPACTTTQSGVVTKTTPIAAPACVAPQHPPPCSDCETGFDSATGCCSGVLDPSCGVIPTAYPGAPPPTPSATIAAPPATPFIAGWPSVGVPGACSECPIGTWGTT